MHFNTILNKLIIVIPNKINVFNHDNIVGEPSVRMGL